MGKIPCTDEHPRAAGLVPCLAVKTSAVFLLPSFTPSHYVDVPRPAEEALVLAELKREGEPET